MALLLGLLGTTGCTFFETRSVPEARIIFQGMPDGPVPPEFGGGPSSLRTAPPEDSATQLRILNGKLTNDPTSPGRTAGYYSTADMGAPITTIGARWTFTPRGGTPGTMALLISGQSLAFPFPVHLVVTPTFWSFGVWPPEDETVQGLQIVKTEQFVEPLAQDGRTVHLAQVELNGERAVLTLPNGDTRTLKDARIADWAGNFATFEAFSDHGTTDSRVGFTEVWARTSVAR